MDIRAGDILLVSKKTSPILKVLQFLQKDEVVYSHSMFAVNADEIIEAKFKIQKRLIIDALSGYGKVKIVRYRYKTYKGTNAISKRLTKLLNVNYGWTRFLLYFLDNLFNTRYFSDKFKNRKNQVCSSLIAWAFYVEYRMKFRSVEWESCDPDDIDDESSSNIISWETFILRK